MVREKYSNTVNFVFVREYAQSYKLKQEKKRNTKIKFLIEIQK
jgi:hypothetical protein